MFQEKINNVISEGYSLNLSEIVSNAYNIVVKKLLLKSILFMLLYLAISITVQYISYWIAGVDIQEVFSTYLELASSGNIERLPAYITSIESELNTASMISTVFSLLVIPLTIGYVEMVKNADLGLNHSFSDLFKPYKSSKLLGLIMIYITIIILSVVGIMLCVLPGFYIMTALSLAPMIYWFNDQVSFGESLTGSLKVVNKNFFNVFFTLIILSLISVVGMLMCYIGIFVTVPITYAGFYFMYKQIFMKKEHYDEIEEIGGVS
ncbi:MAG: hypothetical protein ACK5MD_02370 [Flavobacteriales bacterium]